MATRKITGVRLDSELERAVDEVVKEESIDKSTALRMLVGEGYKEWRLKRALRQLREGKVSFWKASKIAGMELWDFVEAMKKEEGLQWAEFDTGELLSDDERV
jgi:predicted HTH domain antitoxin